MAENLAFQEDQYRFTAYLRDPAHNSPPQDVEGRRMVIYRDLVFNNLEGLLADNFPVLHKILAEECWYGLIRDFLQRHRCHTPLFPEIADEFLEYLQGERTKQALEPDFLLELAHYEWVEMALAIDKREIYGKGYDPNGDLLTGIPVISPLAWPLAYRYPVHQIGPDFQPDAPPAQASYLLVYRDRTDEIGFIAINSITFQLLTLLDENKTMTGAEACRQIAVQMQHPKPELVLAGGEQILDQLKERNVILGAKA